MAEIELPGGIRIEQVKPDQTAQQIVAALAPILQGISNQLDLLIRMECGERSRASVKMKIEQYDAKVKTGGNGQAKPE